MRAGDESGQESSRGPEVGEQVEQEGEHHAEAEDEEVGRPGEAIKHDPGDEEGRQAVEDELEAGSQRERGEDARQEEQAEDEQTQARPQEGEVLAVGGGVRGGVEGGDGDADGVGPGPHEEGRGDEVGEESEQPEALEELHLRLVHGRVRKR